MRHFKLILGVAALFVATAGHADHHEKESQKEAGKAKQEKATSDEAASAGADAAVRFTNKMVGETKTWLPKTLSVGTGETVEVTLVNTLDGPHGFQIEGLVKPVVVKAKSQKKVTFKAAEAGEHNIKCHMHPAHVAGTLEVRE